MLNLHTAERIESLAKRLAGVFSDAPSDPMIREWVAVPSAGMQRWLSLELARHLGSGGDCVGDGVTANIDYAFPGSLRNLVLDADRPGGSDPWGVDRLAWVILAVVDRNPTDPLLTAFARPGSGGSRYSLVRRVADLFDRYHVHRPSMIRDWAAGRIVDSSGRSLAPHQRWQPHLWTLVREQLGVPSPPERLPALLDRLRSDDLVLDLPERLVFFGLTVLPGGTGFLDLAHAVSAHRDLHLLVLEPSAVLTERITSRLGGHGIGERLRSEDDTAQVAEHALLRSWARLNRETAVLLEGASEAGLLARARVTDDAEASASSMLTTLQTDIRANRAPAATLRPGPTDQSIQFHAAHGAARQVEVLRDALLHLLGDDSLGLCEDDIVVVCPALEQIAPIVEAVLGRPATGATPTSGTAHPPALRYRIADRSIGSTNAVLEATTALLELVSGRFEAPAVLDFIAMGPVRERFGFGEDELARITDWIDATKVRWGLDGEHREPFGVPATIANNTWGAALDRILVGAAVFDDGLTLAVGDVVPFGSEGDSAELAGRFAELMWRLRRVVDDIATTRPIGDWIDLLRAVTGELFATPRNESWQVSALHRGLRSILDSAVVDGEPSSTALEFIDVRRLVDQHLQQAPGRPDFFRGGITVTSMTPLRWIPHRVVCLLGIDQTALSVGAVDGDDLVAATPHLGDRDPRSDARQALLEALLAAGDHLIVVRDGHDIRTNHAIPPAVAVAELMDAVAAMIHSDDRDTFANDLEIHHPRQPFDDLCFTPAALASGVDGPWSYDPAALDSARARHQRDATQKRVFMATPLVRHQPEDVLLDDLHRFLKHPVKGFLEQRLKLRLPREEDTVTALLPVAPNGLELWGIGSRLLNALLAGRTTLEWADIERRIGWLAPGVLGDDRLDVVSAEVEELVATADELGLGRGAGSRVTVAVTLGDGTRVTGAVINRLGSTNPGPLRLQYSRPKPAHRVAAWLDLVALVATDPTVDWRSVSVSRGATVGKAPSVFDLVAAHPLGDPARHADAVAALEVAVELYRTGRTEPIPLFASFSNDVYHGAARPSDWPGFVTFSDGNDRANVLAYDHDFEDLMAIAAIEGDPPGTGGRVERYAHYFWETVERTGPLRPVPDGEPAPDSSEPVNVP